MRGNIYCRTLLPVILSPTVLLSGQIKRYIFCAALEVQMYMEFNLAGIVSDCMHVHTISTQVFPLGAIYLSNSILLVLLQIKYHIYSSPSFEGPSLEQVQSGHIKQVVSQWRSNYMKISVKLHEKDSTRGLINMVLKGRWSLKGRVLYQQCLQQC